MLKTLLIDNIRRNDNRYHIKITIRTENIYQQNYYIILHFENQIRKMKLFKVQVNKKINIKLS